MRHNPLPWRCEDPNRATSVARLAEMAVKARAFAALETVPDGAGTSWTWVKCAMELPVECDFVLEINELPKLNEWMEQHVLTWPMGRWPELGLLPGDIVTLSSSARHMPLFAINLLPECYGCTELEVAGLLPWGEPKGSIWVAHTTQVQHVYRLI